MSTAELSLSELFDHCNTLSDPDLRELSEVLNQHCLWATEDEVYELAHDKYVLVSSLVNCRELQDQIDELKDRQESELEIVTRRLMKYTSPDC